MSDIIKKVDRSIPLQNREQSFNKDDAVKGDILRVETSLGYPAKSATITSNGTMAVRFNVYSTVYPHRPSYDFYMSEYYPLVASGHEYYTETPRHEIAANGTLSVSRLIRDVEIIEASGTEYTIFVH